jgi:hypothetical protein
MDLFPRIPVQRTKCIILTERPENKVKNKWKPIEQTQFCDFDFEEGKHILTNCSIPIDVCLFQNRINSLSKQARLRLCHLQTSTTISHCIYFFFCASSDTFFTHEERGQSWIPVSEKNSYAF